MQPYPNPNYYGQYLQPQVNPYLQRMENLQQFQQVIQPPTMTTNQLSAMGKIVESIDVVKVTDIPIDGNMYYFPQADGQIIYGKKYLPNGQTQILAFKPSLESEPNNSTPNAEKTKIDTIFEVLGGIQEDVKTLTDKVDRISKPTKSKKEVEVDE